MPGEISKKESEGVKRFREQVIKLETSAKDSCVFLDQCVRLITSLKPTDKDYSAKKLVLESAYMRAAQKLLGRNKDFIHVCVLAEDLPRFDPSGKFKEIKSFLLAEYKKSLSQYVINNAFNAGATRDLPKSFWPELEGFATATEEARRALQAHEARTTRPSSKDNIPRVKLPKHKQSLAIALEGLVRRINVVFLPSPYGVSSLIGALSSQLGISLSDTEAATLMEKKILKKDGLILKRDPHEEGVIKIYVDFGGQSAGSTPSSKIKGFPEDSQLGKVASLLSERLSESEISKGLLAFRHLFAALSSQPCAIDGTVAVELYLNNKSAIDSIFQGKGASASDLTLIRNTLSWCFDSATASERYNGDWNYNSFKQFFKDFGKLLALNPDTESSANLLLNCSTAFAEHYPYLEKLMANAGENIKHYSDLPSSQSLGVLGEDAMFRSLTDRFKGDAHFVAMLYGCQGVRLVTSVDGKAAEIKKRIDVLKQFGMEFPERFTPEILENAYLTAIGKADMRRKTAFVVLNKDDYNGAFLQMAHLYQSLIDKGYNLILCEANTDMGVAERFFNYGRLQRDSGKISHFKPGAQDHTRYDFVVIGGHGNPSSIQMGKDNGGPSESSYLDLDDYSRLKSYGDWRSMLSKWSAICLVACSTGKEVKPEQPSNFANMMEMMKRLSDAILFAPGIDAGVTGFIFDKNGYVRDVTIADENRRLRMANEIPKRLQQKGEGKPEG